MNEILNKVQTDFNKLQKTLEREGEVLISKIKDAANKAASNKSVVAKRKEFEKLVETQFKKFEPALDKFYKDLKVTAKKYGVNLERLEEGVKTGVKTTKEKANMRLKRERAGGSKEKSSEASARSAPKKSGGSGSSSASAKKKASKKV